MKAPVTSRKSRVTLHQAKREWPLLVTVVTMGLFLALGGRWLADLSHPAWFTFVLGWLFAVILLSTFAVVRA